MNLTTRKAAFIKATTDLGIKKTSLYKFLKDNVDAELKTIEKQKSYLSPKDIKERQDAAFEAMLLMLIIEDDIKPLC